MPYKPTIPLFDLILCISDAVDLISPSVADYHRRIAYFAYQLARQVGLSSHRCREIAIAAALHDVGAITLRERLDLLKFEIEKPSYHAEIGYLMISGFGRFNKAAEMVRFHHTAWNDGAGSVSMGLPVPIESHILHLADRAFVLIDPRKEILSQVKGNVNRIERKTGSQFMPDVVDAFLELSKRDYFWFDLVAPSQDISLWRELDFGTISLEGEEFLEMARFFSRLVDYKSPYTATHSSAVAVCAQFLAELAGFPANQQRQAHLAGYLHDIGKLCVPAEILIKPSALSKDEFAIMRHHSYYTNHILKRMGVVDAVRVWCAYHHERLDGSGYPYQLKADDLPEGARILAIADVFTAVSEDRPYRAGMQKSHVMEVMNDLAHRGLLDARLVQLLGSQFDVISARLLETERGAGHEYERFVERRGKYLDTLNPAE